MNTTNQTRWAVALAALALTLTAACGTQVAPPSGDIGGADGDTSSTDTRHDDNPARLDFGDNGRG